MDAHLVQENMSHEALLMHQLANQKAVEKQFINERINLLSEKQWQLTGDNLRRCRISIDYNRRLLNDRKATVSFHAGR